MTGRSVLWSYLSALWRPGGRDAKTLQAASYLRQGIEPRTVDTIDAQEFVKTFEQATKPLVDVIRGRHLTQPMPERNTISVNV